MPLASCPFSVLVSILLHAAVADSVCRIFVGSLSATVLCLFAITSAVTVLCSQSILVLCLEHVTVAVTIMSSKSVSVLCLK